MGVRQAQRKQSYSIKKKLSVAGRRQRIFIIQALVFVCACLVVFRLFSIQVSEVDKWLAWAGKQHLAKIKVSSQRGDILDRNGRPLASSVPVKSIFIRPKDIKDPYSVKNSLSKYLDLPKSKITEIIDSNRPFIWVARKVPRMVGDKIKKLHLSGVGVIKDSRRYYPYNEAGSVTLGKVGTDGDGLTGLERKFDSKLKEEQFESLTSKDAKGNYITTANSRPASIGLANSDKAKLRNLHLTVDGEIQAIMSEELERGRRENKAKSAFAVMVDAYSGDILGMVQSPSVNLNEGRVSSSEALKDHIVQTSYEPGSVVKPLIVGYALDKGFITRDQYINCENGRFKFGGRTVRDTHKMETVSLDEVVIQSSNIGMSKIGIQLGRENLYKGIRHYGFGEKTNIGISGEHPGILRDYKKWYEIDIATHSFGQGFAVTPLQTVRAIAAIANMGVMHPLKVIKDYPVEEPKEILSPRTASYVAKMMHEVITGEEGTGSRANIPGLYVAGKTGTAQKADKGGKGYRDGAFVASFVGFAKSQDISLGVYPVLNVVVDEPGGKTHFGGTVAAPIFRNIMLRSIKYIKSQRKNL